MHLLMCLPLPASVALQWTADAEAPPPSGGGASHIDSALVSSGAGKLSLHCDQAAPKVEPHVAVVGAMAELQTVVPLAAIWRP